MEEPALLPEKSSQLFPIFLGLSLEQRDIYAVLELSVSNTECLIEEENDGGVVLCLLEIPDLMIPCDILLFFADSLATIDCFRIFRHYLYTEKYVGLLFFSDKASANAFMAQYNHKILSTLFEGVCELCPVTSISIQTKLHHIPLPQYHILQRNFNDMNLAILTSASECEVAQYLAELNRIDDKTRSFSDMSTDQNDSPESTLHQNDICALCLESFIVRHPHSIVLYCGHAFHSSCLVRAEGLFCPVCRFQHAQSLQQAPACHYCRQQQATTGVVAGGVPSSGAQDTPQDTPPVVPWKSPPLPSIPLSDSAETAVSSSLVATEVARDIWLCLVCGVTCCGEWRGHNHRLRHFHETRHAYAMHVFTRRVFDFVENGYVHRLVLRHTHNDTEDDDNRDTPATLADRRTEQDTAEVVDVEEIAHLGDDSNSSGCQDTAGHMSGGKTHHHHHHHHPPLFHLETNMEQQQPAVSSLSNDDVSRHSNPVSVSNRDTTTTTETHATPATSWTRPLHPPPVLLPRDEEGEAEEAHVAVKLEELLQQYNEVLAWRMQQTREHYETQLRRIWQEQAPLEPTSTSTATTTTTGKEEAKMKRSVDQAPHREGLFWLKRLHTSLQQEKHKWLAQNDTLRHKLRMSEQDMQDTLTLVDQLAANEPIWQRQVKRQETLWRQTQQAKSSDKRQWEDKVATLMRRLEETTKFESSVRPSNRVCETAPGDDEET